MNILSAPIDNSIAQRLCNTLYSIMIGLSLKTILGNSKLYNLPEEMYLIIFLLFLYFVLDWLSYNAVTELDNDDRIQHISLLSYILSITSLGLLPVLSTHIVDDSGKFLLSGSAQFTVFKYFLLSYIVLSGIIGHFLINNDINREIESEKAIPSRQDGNSNNNFLFLFVDYGSRLIAVGLIIGFTFFGGELAPEKLIWAYIIAISLITIGKFVRYEKWLLPKVKRNYGVL